MNTSSDSSTSSRPSPRQRALSLSCALLIALLSATSCVDYDAPPLVEIEGTGAYPAGDTVSLRFNEAIDPSTLRMVLWPNGDGERTREGDLIPGLTPLVDLCMGDDACGENNTATLVRATDDGEGFATGDVIGVDLTLDPAGVGAPGSRVSLEILPGLADPDGHDTGQSLWFNLQFNLPEDTGPQVDPIAFDSGVYLIFGTANVEGINVELRLMTDVQALPDNTLALAGAEADKLDTSGDPTDPNNLKIDTSRNGWSIHVMGALQSDAEGKRYLRTELFDVELSIFGLKIELFGVEVQGEVTEDPDTGLDQVNGTLSYERFVYLETTDYGSGNAPISLTFVPEAQVLEGTPQVCDDPCGAVDTSRCQAPEGFPAEGFCDALIERDADAP